MAAAAILKIDFFCHNLSTDCPILTKFCMRKQNGMSTKATSQNLRIFKIQDAGRPPFWKSPFLSEKSFDFDEIRYTIANVGPEYSHVTKTLNF